MKRPLREIGGGVLFEISVINQGRFDVWRLIESKTDGTKHPALSVLKISDILFTPS